MMEALRVRIKHRLKNLERKNISFTYRAQYDVGLRNGDDCEARVRPPPALDPGLSGA